MNNKYKQFLNESTYSFDYDSTLIKYRYERDENGEIEDVVYDQPHDVNIGKLQDLASKGHRIVIVTSRVLPKADGTQFAWDDTPGPEQFIRDHGLPVEEVFYTDGKPKIDTLVKLGVVAHWDDDENEIEHIDRWNRENPDKRIKWYQVPVEEGLTEALHSKVIKLIDENQNANLEQMIMDQFSSHPSGRPYENSQLTEEVSLDNILSGFDDRYLLGFIRRLKEGTLEREGLRDVLTARSIYLFTTHSVETLRDPELFDSDKTRGIIAGTSYFLGFRGPGVISGKKATALFAKIPTKLIYQIANNIVVKLARLENPLGTTTISRGMVLPTTAVDELIQNGVGTTFNMRSIASWTDDFDTAFSFARGAHETKIKEDDKNREEYQKVLFVAENSKFGIGIEDLSGYSSEQEYIVGGRQMIIKQVIIKRPLEGASWAIIKVELR